MQKHTDGFQVGHDDIPDRSSRGQLVGDCGEVTVDDGKVHVSRKAADGVEVGIVCLGHLASLLEVGPRREQHLNGGVYTSGRET